MANPVDIEERTPQDRAQAILTDVLRRRAAGESVDDDAVLAANPELADELKVGLSRLRIIQSASDKASEFDAAHTVTFSPELTPRTAGSLAIRCPHCQEQFETSSDTPVTDIVCDSCGNHFSLAGTGAEMRDAAALASLGHFDLIERIGIGGFGTVWKGRDRKLDRIVAIKIPRQGSLDPAELEKFLREARAAAQLNHPHIVGIYEVGSDGERAFIVGEYVRGVTLERWLARQRPTLRQAVSQCIFVAEALHHAHEQGVIHRDLKPGNVMIGVDGRPRVMDFGLARRQAGEVTMTLDGQLLGTPAYMSPEQALGRGHEADRRSDVYSLGVILFELLTGERPFRGDYVQLLQQVADEEPPSPRLLNIHIPRDLETVALTCLEKDPNRRYQTAKDLAEELRRYLRGEAIQSRPIGRMERGFRWAKREPALAALWLGIMVLATISTIAAVGFFQGQRAVRDALRREQALRQQAVAAADQAKRHRSISQSAAEEERRLRQLVDTQKAELDLARQMAEAEPAETPAAVEGEREAREWQATEPMELPVTDVSKAQNVAVTRLRESSFRSDPIKTIRSMRNLAASYEALGQFEDAVSIYNEAIGLLDGKIAVDGTSPPEEFHELAITLNSLADVENGQSRTSPAREHYIRALEIASDLVRNFNTAAYRMTLGRSHENVSRLVAEDKLRLDEAGQPRAVPLKYEKLQSNWRVVYHAWKRSGKSNSVPDWPQVAASSKLGRATLPELNFVSLMQPPYRNVPVDYFALSATSTIRVVDGSYRLCVHSDDGVRVYVDDEQVIDNWTHHLRAMNIADLTLSKGSHKLRVEYFEGVGGMTLQLGIYYLGPPEIN